MKILSNFPLQMFGPVEDLPFELLSFGIDAGRQEGPDHFDFDLCFDAHEGSLPELFALLPSGWQPDALLFWWPDQEPLPASLQDSPIPVVGILSDYNLSLPSLTRLWPFFDLLLCDKPGLPVLGRLPFARVESLCQYSFRPDVHYDHQLERDIDLSFVGNLNPVVQRERMPWVQRIRDLGDRCRVFVGQVPQGIEYGRCLSRSRIAFNRSIRGEVNLRAFEATACGALLLMERENLEIRDYFHPDRECVLYGPEDLEQKILYLLEHEDERARIAQAGQARVQQYRMASQLSTLPDLIRSLDPASRPKADAAFLLLARGTAQSCCNRKPESLLRPLQEAHNLNPQDPATANNLASVLWNYFPSHVPGDRLGDQPGNQWVELYTEACEQSPRYLPARLNLLHLFRQADMPPQATWMRGELEALLEGPLDLSDFDGLVTPLGYSHSTITLASAWGHSLRSADTTALRHWFLRATTFEGPLLECPGPPRVQELRARKGTGPFAIPLSCPGGGSGGLAGGF